MPVLRASSGQQHEIQNVGGPTSYESGAGISIRSDLGRVDEFVAHAGIEDDSAPWEARADSVTSDNTMIVRVFSQATGTEAADDTDLSAVDIKTIAYRL